MAVDFQTPLKWRKRPDPKLPAVMAVARNATVAGARAAARLARHQPVLVEASRRDERLEICRACEWFRARDERCAHRRCGCYVRIKVRLTSERCPDGRWA